MSYLGTLRPVPLDIVTINKQLGGTVEGDKIIGDDFEINRDGHFKLGAGALNKIREVLEGVQYASSIRLASIGTYDSRGRLLMFFPLMKDLEDFLQEKAEELLHELGLTENRPNSISDIVIKEILCDLIRKNKIVTGNAAVLGLDEYFTNTGFVMMNLDLQSKMVQKYSELIRSKKLIISEDAGYLQRILSRLKQNKEDLAYGLAAALIIEITVRLIVALAGTSHTYDGTHERCSIPESWRELLDRKTVTANELGVEMRSSEPEALMFLNTLEKLRVVRVVDELSRTFEKTGVDSIPGFVACFTRTKGLAAIASTLFHEAMQMDTQNLVPSFRSRQEDGTLGEWQPEAEVIDKVREAFKQTAGGVA